MFGFFKRRRRRRVKTRPFPAAWRTIIEHNVGHWRLLDEAERGALEGHVLVLLDEKEFIGCAGLEITDEIRVTIAAQAALLLLGRDGDYFPGMRTIFVYPSAYRTESLRHEPDGTVIEGPEVRLGESWHRGSIVLSWKDVVDGSRGAGDGHNVVLHEFAHQLDDEVSGHDGAPRLDSRAAYGPWSQVLGDEYGKLVDAVESGRRTGIDPYAAESPAEFFAVVTEEFFEQPLQLQKKHRKLYDQMRSFYRQDPAARRRRARGT